MLRPEQAFYYPDGEGEALCWIFERALSVESLPVTLERGKGFDPLQGTLRSWLLKQADYQLRDWFKKNCNSSEPQSFVAQGTVEEWPAEAPASDSNDHLSYLQKAQLREMIANLSSMRRACMIVKYLGEPEDVDASKNVLQDDDWECLWREQNKKKTQAEQASKLQLDNLRKQLSQLWTVVAARSAGSADCASIHQRDCENRVSRLLGKLLVQQAKSDYYRKRLQVQGIPDDELDELAEQAKEMTLQEISESHSNCRTDERSFMECSQRSWKIAQQLDEAREELERSADIQLPTPPEIADFLNSTVNAVSSALCRAHVDIAMMLVGNRDDARSGENPA
ncbi:MAG: heavy-metal-associated domain-containing protein [Candidatus Melainabacteria bacterium]|nr:heavy-metal-associated domain-containing protein [Candidatus Melainabacteria bacterium]